MKTILIEEKPLLRFGILHSLKQADALMEILELEPQALANTSESADLVVLSLALDDNALVLAESVANRLQPTWILLLADSPADIASNALPTKVCGMLPKNASLDMLAAAIRLILAGGKCFPAMERRAQTMRAQPLLRAPHLERLSSMSPAPLPQAAVPAGAIHLNTPCAATDAALLQITVRQYEVLILLARGFSIKAISRALEISVATVKAHTRTLYSRLDARNKSEAVYTAMQRGAQLDWHEAQAAEPVTKKRASSALAEEAPCIA